MKKLIKVLLVLTILLLISFLMPSISGQFNLIVKISIDVFVAVGLAYVSYPLVRFLKSIGIPKALAILTTISAFFAIFALSSLLIAQLIYPQIINLINILSDSQSTINWFSQNKTFIQIYQYIEPYINNISSSLLRFLANFTQNILASSTAFFGSAVLVISLYAYLLIDYDRIVNAIKVKLEIKTRKYEFFKELDVQFMHYLRGLIIIITITVFEYGIVYYLIGHPDWKALAALCAFSTLIPYFGGIIVNLIALATAVFVSPSLFLMVLACVIILPIIEGNVLYPMIHKKTIKIEPLILLPSIFIFGGLFGILGIILSIPVIILFKIFRKYYAEDVKFYLKRVWDN